MEHGRHRHEPVGSEAFHELGIQDRPLVGFELDTVARDLECRGRCVATSEMLDAGVPHRVAFLADPGYPLGRHPQPTGVVVLGMQFEVLGGVVVGHQGIVSAPASLRGMAADRLHPSR